MALFRFRDQDGKIHEIWLQDGNDGYTPKKGVDYFTPEDVAEIVAQASAEAKAAAVEEALSVLRAPTLKANSTWYSEGTQTTKETITEIRILDSYTATGAEAEYWNADTENDGKIKCYIDGTVLIIAGNGAGRIMANADASRMFTSFKTATKITGLDLIDTRDVENLYQAFANLGKMELLDGLEGWDVRKCESFKQMFTQATTTAFSANIDLSRWDVSRAVEIARGDTDGTLLPLQNVVKNCGKSEMIAFNKTFDLSYFFMPIRPIGAWVDVDTGIVYDDTNDDKMITTTLEGLPNPCTAGRNITFVAVYEEPEVSV